MIMLCKEDIIGMLRFARGDYDDFRPPATFTLPMAPPEPEKSVAETLELDMRMVHMHAVQRCVEMGHAITESMKNGIVHPLDWIQIVHLWCKSGHHDAAAVLCILRGDGGYVRDRGVLDTYAAAVRCLHAENLYQSKDHHGLWRGTIGWPRHGHVYAEAEVVRWDVKDMPIPFRLDPHLILCTLGA